MSEKNLSEWRSIMGTDHPDDRDELVAFLITPSGYEVSRMDKSATAVVHDEDGNKVYDCWQQDGEVIRVVAKKIEDGIRNV